MLKWLRKHLAVRESIKLALIAVLILTVVVLILRQPDPTTTVPVNVSVPATPAPAVKHKPKKKKAIAAKTVEVYPSSVKAESKLPEAVVEDLAKDVVSSIQVKPDHHSQTVTTLIDTETGKFETYYKRDPAPWFAKSDAGEFGLDLVARNGEPLARVDGRKELFQVKEGHVSAIGSVAHELNGGGKTDWEIGFRLSFPTD